MPDALPDVPNEMLEGIGNAVEADASAQATAEPAVAPINPSSPVTPDTPEGSTEAEAVTEAPDSFTKLDPNALPPEARPFYDSMLSDYTRKTQEAAPWRKLGEELGIDSPESVKEAAELYAYLSDPNNLQSFYSQLGQVFGGQAPSEPATPASPAADSLEAEYSGLEDPQIQAMRGELEGLKSYLVEREAAQQQEALEWQLLGELNRQEAALKESHPEWGDEEWATLWNASVATNGDLHAAASMLEAAQNAAVTRLLNGKAQAASTEGLTPLAPPRVAADAAPEWDHSDHELKEETARAVEYLRQVAAQSE